MSLKIKQPNSLLFLMNTLKSRHAMRLTIVGLFTLLIAPNLHGQTVDNILAAFDGQRVTVAYNLESSKKGQRFNVLVYSSHDNYTKALAVAGDAGENVTPGNGKQIVWEAKRDLPSAFNADVQIKIKATPQSDLSVLSIQPLALNTYKKGRSISINWSGGNPADKLTLELYKDGNPNRMIASAIDNRGNYDWKIPQDVKGKKYSFRLVNAASPAQHSESEKFAIKSRTPLAVKIAPVILVSAGAAFLILGGEIDD
jgi:Ser-Thr-rich glycosyl-phosphatidyl-inositol-anchored membrane family